MNAWTCGGRHPAGRICLYCVALDSPSLRSARRRAPARRFALRSLTSHGQDDRDQHGVTTSRPWPDPNTTGQATATDTRLDSDGSGVPPSRDEMTVDNAPEAVQRPAGRPGPSRHGPPGGTASA